MNENEGVEQGEMEKREQNQKLLHHFGLIFTFSGRFNPPLQRKMWLTKELVQSPVPKHPRVFLCHSSWRFGKRKLWKFTSTQKLFQEDTDPNEKPQRVWVPSPRLPLRLGCPLVEANDKGASGVPSDEWQIPSAFHNPLRFCKEIQKYAGGKAYTFDREKKQQVQRSRNGANAI